MKRIDLHIHTIPTMRESQFTYSIDAFKRYVIGMHLDAVAITNHNIFDAVQFKAIKRAIGIPVFPGVEVNLDSGHILIIGKDTDGDEFEAKTRLLPETVSKGMGSVSFEELAMIFVDLGDYLIIPHYDKSPAVTGQTLEKLRPYVSAGEVDSVKKFIRATKDAAKLTPVLFSDARIKEDLTELPTRQTFIDCGEATFDAIRACLRDKSKVAISENDGNRLWEVLEGRQKLSTGLNIILGERSSGKTYTLNRINTAIGDAKYIAQFSLVQQDEGLFERNFRDDVERRRSCIVDEYLSGLKRVVDNVLNVDLDTNNREIDLYIESLLKSAADADRQDAFSKTRLFDEVSFPLDKTETLCGLIESLRQVIENIEFKSIIDKHLEAESLKSLICELIELLWRKTLENKKKQFANEIIKETKQRLKLRTARTQIEEVDLYKFCMDKVRVEKFTEIVSLLKKESVIFSESLRGFRIEVTKGPFIKAGEIKRVSGVNTGFSGAFAVYDNPYNYLRVLSANEALTRSELYKLFTKISYRILNKDGFEVSGGERSEFRLLQQINEAPNHEVLLIDEPESSFDNLFLKSDVNQLLKDISKSMPVVVVTHNSTVGASIGADYLLYTKKDFENGRHVYRIYSGHPTDKWLLSSDGKKISNYQMMMNSLEAGVDTYDGRRRAYEDLKD